MLELTKTQKVNNKKKKAARLIRFSKVDSTNN